MRRVCEGGNARDFFEMAPGILAAGAGGRRQAFRCIVCAKGEMLANF